MEKVTRLLSIITAIIGTSSLLAYFIIFIILTLCGIGLPVPEDIVLIAAGIFVYHNSADLYMMIIVSLLGVIVGDYLIFLIGRKWGIWFLNHRIFKGAFSERRIEKVHSYFDKYGNKTIFFARFIWGLRAATFFIAGTHTMNALKFVALDFLGALISIPLIIYLAYHFGGEIEMTVKVIKQTNNAILSAAILVIAFFVIRHFFRKKKNPSL